MVYNKTMSADGILKFKKFTARVIESTDFVNPWKPSLYCNDYYPKYLLNKDLMSSDLFDGYVATYYQKDEFESLELTGKYVVIEPPVNGWSISFENISIDYEGKKFLANQPSLTNVALDFSDNFFRFADLYTFDGKISAVSEFKRKAIDKSFTY